MKQVDIIRPGSINAIIGPVGTLKRMLKNQEYFNSRGYHVTVFTDESIEIGPIQDPPPAIHRTITWKSKLRQKIGSFLRVRAQKNFNIARWFLDRDKKRIEALVDYYLALNRTPDIIQFHSDYECQVYLKKRNGASAKTVLFLHTDGIPFKMTLVYFPCLKGSTYLNACRENVEWTVANTDRINFIAKIGQENFLKYYPNRSENDTSVIINGIDDLTEEQNNEVKIIRMRAANGFKYRLCCTGTINFRKGQRIIIEALHNLPIDILKQTHLDLIGDGGERPVLEGLVHKYGLDENVRFWGMVPNVEVYKYLAENNIYLLMSKNEGLPISIIEAMRAGLPIISTNVSGIPELVDVGHNGFLLNPDVNELTVLLSKLPNYDWELMGKNSRKRFEKEFTFERMAKEFCDMYDSLFA